MDRNVHLHSHPSRIEHWRHLIEIVAFIAAACWAIYVFVYQERIKPETSAPRVRPIFAVEQHRLRGARTYIKVHLELKNFGESVASIGIVNVNVYGVTYGSKVSAYALPSSIAPGLIQLGHALAPGSELFLSAFTNEWNSFGGRGKTLTIAPNDLGDQSFAFAIPEREVDALLIRYQICWSHPSDYVWNEPLAQSPDGSYNFVHPKLNTTANQKLGLHCAANYRGEPFPL